MVLNVALRALLEAPDVDEWSRNLFGVAAAYGYEHVVYFLLPHKNATLDSGFVRSNCAEGWRKIYERDIYPVLLKDSDSTTPVILIPTSRDGTQRLTLYDDMDLIRCNSLPASVSFPIHGSVGEFGVISFITQVLSQANFQRHLTHSIPTLALIRDYVFQSSLKYMRKAKGFPLLTPRETECLTWVKEGKSSWEISSILNCSQSTVNFHINNVREKFKVRTRQQAVIKAINMGILMAN